MGRPSIDPDLMIRMLIIGYCMGIRSERRLCEEVHLNLAYRWFCRRCAQPQGCVSIAPWPRTGSVALAFNRVIEALIGRTDLCD
jgi:transposase